MSSLGMFAARISPFFPPVRQTTDRIIGNRIFLFFRWIIDHKVEARSVNVMNTHTHTHYLWWSLLRFLPKHMSFMWDSVDDMTSTHELPTRYRPLFGMFGRSTYERVTSKSNKMGFAYLFQVKR